MKIDKLIVKSIWKRKTNKNWQIFLDKRQGKLPLLLLVCFFSHSVYHAGRGMSTQASLREEGVALALGDVLSSWDPGYGASE